MTKLTLNDLNKMELFTTFANKALDAVREDCLSNIVAEMEHRSRADIPGFESPLEALFWFWWHAEQYMRHITPDVWLLPQHAVTVCRQSYRLDFAVVPSSDRQKHLVDIGGRVPRIAVELDGHDFHERTKEQVTYRNQRDRDLQADGWLVLHYSGSEFVRAPYESVYDCHSKADEAIYRATEDAWNRKAAERAAGYKVDALMTD